MSNVQEAIKQAQVAAGAIVSDQVATTASVPSTQVAPRRITLADNNAGGMSVDTWLKVDEYGLHLGDDKSIFDKIEFNVDLSTVAYCRCVRFGNPATYRKTYDMVNDSQGGSWADTVMRAQKIDARCRGDYASADIPFIAVSKITGKDGKILLDVGQKAGFAPSVTGWAEWKQFTDQLAKSGIDPENGGVVRVTLKGIVRKNKAGNEWGVVGIESFALVQS